MKHSLIAPLLALGIAAPALAQATFGDLTIPASQALPPAGFDQVAFRPSCPQVVPVGQANGLTAWTLPMPDGVNLTLLELEPMGSTQAHMVLDSYGLCKIGGDAVPIVYSRQLPQRSLTAPLVQGTAGATQTAMVEPDAPAPSGGVGLLGLVASSVVLLGLGVGVVAWTRRTPKPLGAGPAPAAQPKDQPQAKPNDRAATVKNLFED